MSGLGNSSSANNANRIWLYIKEGKIIKRDNGQTEKYDHLTGMLKDLFVKRDGKYGPELHVTLRAGGIDYTLQMRLDSGYARSFMKIAPNFTLSQEMSLFPSIKYKETGNTETGMFIRQNGVALKWYYTKDNPNGLPPMVPCKVRNDRGQLVDSWDNTEQMNFLVEQLMVIRDLLPPASVIENKENIASVQGTQQGSFTNYSNSQPIDDLPF